MVVERKIAAEEGKTRHDCGRVRFIDKIWQWKAESGGTITRQIAVSATPLTGSASASPWTKVFQCVKEVFVILAAKT